MNSLGQYDNNRHGRDFVLEQSSVQEGVQAPGMLCAMSLHTCVVLLNGYLCMRSSVISRMAQQKQLAVLQGLTIRSI
jgi:hypothetical protein